MIAHFNIRPVTILSDSRSHESRRQAWDENHGMRMKIVALSGFETQDSAFRSRSSYDQQVVFIEFYELAYETQLSGLSHGGIEEAGHC